MASLYRKEVAGIDRRTNIVFYNEMIYTCHSYMTCLLIHFCARGYLRMKEARVTSIDFFFLL